MRLFVLVGEGLQGVRADEFRAHLCAVLTGEAGSLPPPAAGPRLTWRLSQAFTRWLAGRAAEGWGGLLKRGFGGQPPSLPPGKEDPLGGRQARGGVWKPAFRGTVPAVSNGR